ncbi:MAG: hypothetical protein RJB66_1199 [Pseudomonadota bacterium]|jgi:Zn-dependent protease with chaperone function
MKRTNILIIIYFLFCEFFFNSGCASTTSAGSTGVDRKQLFLVSSSDIERSSAEAYEQVKREAAKKGNLDKNSEQLNRLKIISRRLIPHSEIFRNDSIKWDWEVHLESNPQLNAYCMPGGKIMFYTGIIDQLKLTDGEIAAIMGHEIAHALREHGRERMSEQLIKIGIIKLGVETGVVDKKYEGALLVFSSLVIDLPHNRGQETEADVLGLELMARGGYNPQEAITLWQKMGASGAGKPPEFLSTHPSDSTRIKNIRANLEKVLPLYRAAQR